MATQETKQIDEIISSRRAMMMMGGTALAGLAFAGAAKAQATITDTDILNFALNLEYLEANFYYLAAFGVTIDKAANPISIKGGGTADGGPVVAKVGPKVPFTTIQVGSYATETAIEEGKHVILLQKALGAAAVAQPPLDLLNSFNVLAAAAGIGPAFDPFASDANFLIGAYIFEDVGVTAYAGAAALISDHSAGGVLETAAGILAVEGYHAGLIRATINAFDTIAGNTNLSDLTKKISAARAALSGKAIGVATANDDIGVGTQQVSLAGASNVTALTLVDVDSNALTYTRSAAQVLSIVTGGAPGNKGVFFPAGLNGTIK